MVRPPTLKASKPVGATTATITSFDGQICPTKSLMVGKIYLYHLCHWQTFEVASSYTNTHWFHAAFGVESDYPRCQIYAAGQPLAWVSYPQSSAGRMWIDLQAYLPCHVMHGSFCFTHQLRVLLVLTLFLTINLPWFLSLLQLVMVGRAVLVH